MTRESVSTATEIPKTLLLGIKAPYNRIKDLEGYFQEFISLAKTNGLPTDETLFIKLREINSAYFLTKGKVEELKQYCDTHNIKAVVTSEPLSAQQERNLTDFLECRVFDRTRLILEIFEKAALSEEGKTQVAIAMLKHKKSRLSGKGIHMAQQRGIRGLRSGFGETLKEREARHIHDGILKFEKKLEKLESNRKTQRKQRLESSWPLISLIGYTNSGKSTILNALTKSSVLAEDKLFATLDTTSRELYIGSKKTGIISDTVGFIQLLPHQLIEAFKSTLSELHFADLLLIVIDSSDPNWQDHVGVVHQILNELEVNSPILYVFNKQDKIVDIDAFKEQTKRYEPHVLTSALETDGLKTLKSYLTSWSNELKTKSHIQN